MKTAIAVGAIAALLLLLFGPLVLFARGSTQLKNQAKQSGNLGDLPE